MLNNDSENIFDRYILIELFETFYPLKEIIGISIGGREIKFKNINQIFSYHIKNKNTSPIFYIKCYFLNKKKEVIELYIHPISMGGNLFIEDVNEIFTIIFGLKEDKQKLKTYSFDAIPVTTTVMKTVLDFLNSLKKIVNLTTKDWEKRIQKGISRFDPYPNMSINPVSKQIRSEKESQRGISQRANLYISAFNKIIKPYFPELNIENKNNYYLIKS
jgi:hypothetical protein